jgi:hypothetical protein
MVELCQLCGKECKNVAGLRIHHNSCRLKNVVQKRLLLSSTIFSCSCGYKTPFMKNLHNHQLRTCELTFISRQLQPTVQQTGNTSGTVDALVAAPSTAGVWRFDTWLTEARTVEGGCLSARHRKELALAYWAVKHEVSQDAVSEFMTLGSHLFRGSHESVADSQVGGIRGIMDNLREGKVYPRTPWDTGTLKVQYVITIIISCTSNCLLR